MPSLAGWQWALGALCAFLVGVAKTGVPGLGILVVPLMVIAVGDARQSAGWLLPLLCAADLFAVGYYRRHTHVGKLLELLPWVAVGMGAGYLALGMNDALLRPLIGVIVFAMIGAHVWRKRRLQDAAAPARLRHSAVYGGVAGFATMVANAAGPVMNVYLLSKKLAKDQFIATGAWFFLIINLSKLPAYGARGMLSRPSLLFDLALLPALLVGVVSGRAIFVRLPQRRFEAVVLTLAAAATALLFAPALRR